MKNVLFKSLLVSLGYVVGSIFFPLVIGHSDEINLESLPFTVLLFLICFLVGLFSEKVRDRRTKEVNGTKEDVTKK